MINLEQQIKDSARELDGIRASCQRVPENGADTVLPGQCYVLWQKRAELGKSLAATLDLFPARSGALSATRALLDAMWWTPVRESFDLVAFRERSG